MKNSKVYLTLENGRQFTGFSFGAQKEVVGELVFTTGMTGYIETLTDPSYYGQIVTQTFPLIGNYGMIEADMESKKSWVTAYIVREKCDKPSNFRCEGTIDDFLKKQGIPGIYGIDTRELTKIVREAGVMNAAITKKPLNDLSEVRSYVIKDAVKSVTCSEIEYLGDPDGIKIAVWDFGAKCNIMRELAKRGCYCMKVPSYYTAEQILALEPQGLMLTNGPGDPSENTEIILNIRKLAGKLPIFGICLGHQLFALAMGGKTKKMKYGHRGSNQPVKNLDTGRVYISSQNHGYEVISSSVEGGKLSFVNANDGTCEGFEYPELNAYTVQFHPEACGGPMDASFLFDKFILNIKEGRYHA
ncbi:MAG TPA: glutamine-hydrolyzing carbamoyl-phosphate synthase small subunit [Candidatus Coproplasma stercoripullorum]|uniref:Carbamoyl phosphate synthase small chain n=1 Tax=Candidatus Coproplasma stercoripullorum TaxID=2840751 RepID=A0A9D1AGJ0_9FIRM|nr:glutamine-hydrolyzing carbamoyl-phosphate synthase small subunit [Candidatus Coproplasma stercoripullorum]